ncbi:tetratricopeptide repeat protein [candidate division WOR-3 bacterium]|nr:tetratricopeptide repeat protein [candidate division WOR-3 bacterium]
MKAKRMSLIRTPLAKLKTCSILPAILVVFALIGCSGGNVDKTMNDVEKDLEERNFTDALHKLDLLTKKHDELPPRAHYLYGRVYLGHMNLPEAELHFSQLLQMDEGYRDSVALAYRNRGIELGKVGKRELSIECLEEAMRISPAIDMSNAYVLMGELYTKYGEVGRAVHYYRRALNSLKDSTTRALTWEKLIKLLERMGDPGDAFLATEQAMHEHHYYLESRYCQNGYKYAEDLLHRGVLDSADLIMTRVLQVPLSPMLRDDIFFLAGEIRFKNGDIEGAKEAYREVLKLSVNASRALIQRARDRLTLLGEEVE